MASNAEFKRTDSVAETMPDALKQSRYYMKKCFARYFINSFPYLSIIVISICIYTMHINVIIYIGCNMI